MVYRDLVPEEGSRLACSSSKGSPWLPQQLSSRSEAGVKAAQRQGAKRRRAKRRGTRVALMLRPSGDYLARAYVFGSESSRRRRHYIRSFGSSPAVEHASARE